MGDGSAMDSVSLWQNLKDALAPLLEALGLSDHRRFIFFVVAALGMQAFVLFLIFGVAIASRLFRKASRRDDRARRRRFEAILQRDPPAVRPSDFSRGSRFLHRLRYQKGEIYFFRRFLVETAELTHDKVKIRQLFTLYRQLDFDRLDYKLLKSWAWWRRLSAVIRLETFSQNESVDPLLAVIEDEHDLVSLAALRTLSKMKFENKTERILETLSRRAPGRRDLFAEVMTNMGQEEISALLKFVKECFDPYIASVAIAVLGRLRAREAIPLCLHLLQSADDLVVTEAVNALAILKAQESITPIRRLLTHDSVDVRSQALSALRALGDPQWKLWAQRALEDASASVQRVAYDLVGDEIRYV